MNRPTQEQVEHAFVKAAGILAQVEALGVKFPSLELHSDASGTLWFLEPVTPEQWERMTELVHSTRLYPLPLPPGRGERTGIQFCYGLINVEDGDKTT